MFIFFLSPRFLYFELRKGDVITPSRGIMNEGSTASRRQCSLIRIDTNGPAGRSSKMYCGQCLVLRWCMGLIIQCIYGSFSVGKQGNGFSKKNKDFFFTFTLQNLADNLCTTKCDIKQVNALPTQCIGVF